jgi:long-chain fatty acid transport protein
MPVKSFVRVAFLLAGSLVVSTPAFAQRDLEIPIQFDFINPGARSLALAGAFIGLADDATAATTNPAGLRVLARPEVSVEGRGWQFITDFVQGGRLSGTATQRDIDLASGPVFGQTKDRVGGLAFISVVYPRGQWSVAGYRQEASRVRATAETQGAFYTADDGRGFLRDYREYPTRVDRTIDVINYGASVSRRTGKFSFGAGIVLSQFSFESSLIGYEVPGVSASLFYTAATFSQRRYSSLQSSDDVGLGFIGGFQFVPSNRVQLGLTFRRGASFEFDGALEYPGDPAFQSLAGTYSGEFKVPDNLGVGVAVRPLDGLTIAADVNRVFYSDLQSFVQSQVRFRPLERSLYTIDDAMEIHVGAEYVLTRWGVLPAIRGGYWRETDHALTYSGTELLYSATAALAQDFNHVSFGAGVSLSRRLELNAGFDFSKRANTTSISAIVRF